MMPVAAFNLLQSIELLATVVNNFSEKCIEGLKATKHGPEQVERGLALCTALVPEVGYDLAAEISHEAFETGSTVREVASKKTKLTEAELKEILDPFKMTKPGLGGGPAGG
jgi:fumarate hydratase class II